MNELAKLIEYEYAIYSFLDRKINHFSRIYMTMLYNYKRIKSEWQF